MKQGLIILVVTAFLFQYLGVFLALKIEQHQIRKAFKTQIKQSVSEEELVVFRFTKDELSQLVWLKEHEFKYGDTYYDVVRKEKTGDEDIILYCVSDEQETQLFKRLDMLVANQMQSDPDQPLRTFVHSKIFKSFIGADKFRPFFNLSFLRDCSTIYVWNYCCPLLELVSPPPKKLSHIF